MSVNKPLAERLLALLLAGATAFSPVPTAALAEAVDEATPQAAAAQVAGEEGADVEGTSVDDASGDGNATQATDGGAVDAASGDSAEKQASGEGADSAKQSEAEPKKGESAESGADASVSGSAGANTDAASGQPASDASDATTSADQTGENAVALASAQPASDESTALSSNAKVYIQSVKDCAYSSSYTRSGALKVGETIYANMFDGASSYSLKGVPNPGTWSYTWLAGTVASSSSASDYTEVVGTDQALTITADMTGKYLICKVTVDGVDHYGPSVSYGSGINANYIPGPVLAAGQAELYSVKLSNSAPSVGDTLTATAYTDYSTPAGDDVDVTFAWSYADSKNGAFTAIDGATGNTFNVTEAYKGKYIKVTASAGANEKHAVTSSAVLAEGAVTLAGVELSASSAEVGATLTAKAYSGSSYSPTYVDNSKVTYTWKKYKGGSAPNYSTTWETIQGASGPTLTVTDDLEGYYVTVFASAGDNEVKFGDYYSGYGAGPFKLAGAVEIYSAILAPAGSTSGSYVYTVDQTVCALAKEKGASDFIDSSKLSYQWQASDEKDGTYADIAGATQSALSLAGYEGKFVRCVVKSAIGSSAYTTRATNAVAAAGSVNVTKVSLDVSSKSESGKTITATATASGTDVTSSEKVSWSWYWGESGSACTNKIEGAATNTFTPDAATYAGKYVQARANGGFGDEKSNAVAVVEAGSVELYGVSVSGAQGSGAVQVGATLTAKATKGNSYTSVESSDTVHYQWQYATSKTTSDGSFQNIPGAADRATYVVDGSMAGNYIRVIATSENSVKSTQSKSYYGGTTSVDPVGPVTPAGQYKLASIAPAEATTSTLNVGTVLTPSVKIPGSSSWTTSDLPSDAKLTLAWYTSDDGKAWDALADGVDAETGALTLGESLIGKYVKVTANSLDNTVEWVSKAAVSAAGVYDLLRVTASPQINSSTTSLVTGDTVAAGAWAKRVDGSATNGIDVTSKVSFAWYAVDADDNATLLEGLTGPSIQVPESAAGKKLKVVAASGGSSVELVSANDVVAKDSLAGAVQQLKGANKSLSVAYSADGANINDLLKNQLADLGYTDIDVRVKSVKFSSADKNATVGISASDDDANGDVTFFFIDPNAYTGYNIDGLRRATVTFELSRDGETAEYAPSKTAEVAWDEAKLQSLLDDAAKSLSIGYSAGDSADSVTKAVTLPYRAGSANKFAVTWESSDASAVSVDGYGWSDYTGEVTRFSADRAVTLTATVKLVSGNDSLSGTAEFPVTVMADPAKVEDEKAELQSKLDGAFTYGSVTYSGTQDVADKDGLTADLQMPRPAAIGVDGKEYSVTYSADTDGVVFNGYKGTVYQPQAGDGSASVKLTCTVTSKENPEVSVSKTLDYAIAPQDADDLARELKLMEAAKTGYAAAILNGQDASAVAGNMHAFQKAYLDADGNLAWAYNATDASAAGSGIVPVELEGYDDMGTQGWRLFKSSDSSVVSHENLLVTQPEYNTKVTITSRLTSEKYARYAERYPDNADYAKLAGQDVSATVTVKGAKGDVNPEVSVTCSVFGVDADGNQQLWAAADSYTLANGSTAADVTEALLKKTGLTADTGMASWGWYLNSITSPFDPSLTPVWDASTGRYWQLFVNGKSSDLGAGSLTLNDGDAIIWAYSAYGDEAPTDKLKVTCEVVGVDADGNRQVWAQPTTVGMAEGATAAQLSEQVFAQAGIAADTGTGSWGWYLNSLTSPTDPDVVLSTKQLDADTWEYWQLFINGELAQVGAGGYTLKAGDAVSWVYGSDGAMPGHVSATAEVVGVDGDGNAETWGSRTIQLVEGSTAADLSEALFTAAGIDADYGTSTWGWMLSSITHGGKTYAWDQETGKYWHLYVNGEASSSMASGVTVQSGDKISWVYEADATPEPDPEPTPDPDDDWKAEWPGYGDGGSGSATTDALTPQGNAGAAWTFDYSTYGQSASEPVIANGYVFLAAGKKLLKIDYATGKVVASCDLVASVGFTTRPVIADGFVVVPLQGGRVQAVSAKTMQSAWATEAVSKDAQANSTVTVDKVGDEWYVNVGTVDVDYSAGTYNNGHFVRIRLSDGSVAWTHLESDEGYYWDGAASAGDYLVASTSAGTLQVLSKETGDVVSSVKLGAVVNSDPVVSADGSNVYVISRDGKLHVVPLGEGGKLGADTVVDTGLTGCACAPTLAGGKLIVGGEKGDSSALAIIDLATNKTQLITCADGSALPVGFGGVKGVPLVSEQADGTYVYFTVNAADTADYVHYTNGGGVYRYKLGDAEATLIYDAAGHNQYCDSPVVCDKYGNLYYINDSGTLFKLSDGALVVLFDSQGGSDVAARRVLSGACVAKPGDPTRDGYAFAGWYADAACTKAWDFSASVTADMTLYAKWVKAEKKDDPKKEDESKKEDTKRDDAEEKKGSEKKGSGSISLSGNGSSKGRGSLALALRSGSSVKETRTTTAFTSLLSEVASGEATAQVRTVAEGAGAAETQVVSSGAAGRGIPVWPFIGMGVGVAGLIAVAASKRGKEDEQ